MSSLRSVVGDSDSATEASMYAAEDAASERLVDLSTPLTEDVALRLLTEKDVEALKVVRHSAAHVMATAVLELFPETKLGHGPATDSGFFYDFYRPTPFTPEDLKAIEDRMAVIVARDEKFVREYAPRDEGLLRFKAENDFMKMHFIERFTQARRKNLSLSQWRICRLLPWPACAFHQPRQSLQGDEHCRRLLAGR